jgi:hypothetical protein
MLDGWTVFLFIRHVCHFHYLLLQQTTGESHNNRIIVRPEGELRVEHNAGERSTFFTKRPTNK